MIITAEEIRKKFESLPEDLQWAIMGANVDDNVINIGQTEKLNVEQMDILALEIHKVMLGFTHPDKFEETLKSSLKFDDGKTRSIVNAVNEKILKGIREKMMAGYKDVSKTEETEEKKDAQILNSAGIEIVPEKLELNTPKEEGHQILAQKLSGFSKNEVIKTEHTLENITKLSEAPTTPTASPKAYPNNADPYRMKPE